MLCVFTLYFPLLLAGVEMTEMLLFDENTSEVQVNISISDDNIFEELLETFTVNLVCDPSDAVIVDPKTATVSIRDGELMVGYIKCNIGMAWL